MSTDPTRSEQVIADFKRRKLARSALCQIQRLIHDFEEGYACDRRLARIGVIVVLLLVTVSLFLLFSSDSVTLH
jgi:hypothetical protein